MVGMTNVDVTIEKSWSRVTAWLAAHAPQSFATLRPPASAAELDACERDAHVVLPEDLRRLLLMNNGATEAMGSVAPAADFMPEGHRLMSAAEIAASCARLTKVVAADPSMLGYWWDPQWVLFATYGNGDGLVIDQRPGPDQGTIGEFFQEDSATFNVAPSIGVLIAEMANALENGTDMLTHGPNVADGVLEWQMVLQD